MQCIEVKLRNGKKCTLKALNVMESIEINTEVNKLAETDETLKDNQYKQNYVVSAFWLMHSLIDTDKKERVFKSYEEVMESLGEKEILELINKLNVLNGLDIDEVQLLNELKKKKTKNYFLRFVNIIKCSLTLMKLEI